MQDILGLDLSAFFMKEYRILRRDKMKKLLSQIDVISKGLNSLQAKLEKLKSELAQSTLMQKKVTRTSKATKKEPAPKKTIVKKTTVAADGAKPPILDKVFDAIKRSKNGATIASLKAKTNLESRQLSNALYKLGKKGLVKTIRRGVYVKA